MIVKKTSIFPASQEEVFSRLQHLETLQYIAAPLATFSPTETNKDFTWQAGASSSYHLKLWGFIPLGIHSIRIERFDHNGIQSYEHNKHVPVWNPLITLNAKGDQTEYTDEVEIHAGWKTIFVWLWAKAFYSHRQKKWIKLLKSNKK